MNIQIFGTKKCNDTKKAERFFKERGIKYQFIDMKAKGMSKGEFTSVAQSNGGLENMINWEDKDRDTLALIKYIADEDKQIVTDLLDTLRANLEHCVGMALRLSLKGVRSCTRYQEIEVDYLDQNFKKQHGKYSGWTAQIIQHEIDHCNGIVI